MQKFICRRCNKTTDSDAENQTGETVNGSDVENNASENAAAVEPLAAGNVSVTITDNIENSGTLNAQLPVSSQTESLWNGTSMPKGRIHGQR